MGKFTVIQETESSTGEKFGPTPATEEVKQESPQDSVDTFSIKSSQTTRRRSKRDPVKPVVQAVAETPANYHLWSQLVIGSANTVVVTWLGAECAMEKREADMLEPPIARILARLTPEQSQKVSVFIDPMVMLIALGMWGNRIIRIQRAKRDTITDTEFARASGMVDGRTSAPASGTPNYEPSVEPSIPSRERVEVNPNGVPVAITSQMGEL